MCRCCVYSCGESSHDELIVAVYYLLTDDMHMNDTEMKEVHFFNQMFIMSSHSDLTTTTKLQNTGVLFFLQMK